MMINFILKSSEFVKLLICKKSRGLFLFKRNEKKNRKGTLTPKMPFFEHQLPRAYHLKCLSNLSEEEIENGCRDSAPSKTVLKQIRYEARKVLTPFEDESKSLSEIHLQQRQYCIGMTKGTLQMILSRPRGINPFSESMVCICHSLARTDIVYADAAGSVLLGDKSCYALYTGKDLCPSC